ncbi:MAG: DUF3604 domain-containing protein, partial [Burkholderiales bacterium]
MKNMRTVGCVVLAALAVAGIAVITITHDQAEAQDVGTIDKATAEKVFPAKPPYSPYVGRNFPTRPYFGDTHLHTAISMDAGATGARLSPADAYRFARGEEVTASSGQPAKLSRPLDFLVVADHSDGMGFFPLLMRGDPKITADPQGRRWNEMLRSGKGAEVAYEIIINFGKGTISKAIMPVPGTPAYRGAWEETIKAAEEANSPGRFTAFIGFEWTPSPGGNNLHRNVIYRDGGAKAIQIEPYTATKPLGSDNPVDLWKWMAAYEEKTGGRVLAIAHNGNLSNGRMFPVVEAFGKKLDRAYAEARMKWERLYEVTQTKGDSETHPFLSPNDEFASFERWDKANLDVTVPKTKDMFQFEYARTALLNGLKLEQSLGVNPYKFGMIGSTDAHTGLAAVEEENFFGKITPGEPGPHRLAKEFMANPKSGVRIMEWEVSSSGYAAVWATANTREAIWDAMERRETYATTGPRMVVRFFGGWEFEAADAKNRLPAHVGYTKGVPMGGDLRDAPKGKSPTFLVAALRDPIGANLDRIQIVKGWLDKSGKVQEKIYDVVWGNADKRKPDAKGKLPPVGSTVDVENATWTNTIGDPELITVWKDPAFDPAQRAFYYARVLEIPTPRWTAYDAKYFNVKMPPAAPMFGQER